MPGWLFTPWPPCRVYCCTKPPTPPSTTASAWARGCGRMRRAKKSRKRRGHFPNEGLLGRYDRGASTTPCKRREEREEPSPVYGDAGFLCISIFEHRKGADERLLIRIPKSMKGVLDSESWIQPLYICTDGMEGRICRSGHDHSRSNVS